MRCRKPFLYSQGAHGGDQIINAGEGRAGGASPQAVGTEFQERPKAGKCERRLQQTQARTGPGESCLWRVQLPRTNFKRNMAFLGLHPSTLNTDSVPDENAVG
ncbi:hypothetical protein MJG53_019302 [Ovis ammon polii x Ovis aries]|uniref:Uncharacterized protein n=1 Tax=Ovis ammon polii x Ovis aries TaxID=2918886 RepID=A0ACB9U336_9CETA|nr:hypothetical protein MJG53_019302 [Ovis ammon polii x Ovis aries]